MRLGFEKQWPISGTCSRHALRHALLMVRVSVTEQQLSAAMNRPFWKSAIWGTDEQGIIDGAAQLGCSTTIIASKEAKQAKEQIDSALGLGNPVIVCVDKWEHWAVLAGLVDDAYLCIDSDKTKVARIMSWELVETWLECEGEEKPYYGIVISHEKSRSLVPNASFLFAILQNRNHARGFGELLMEWDRKNDEEFIEAMVDSGI